MKVIELLLEDIKNIGVYGFGLVSDPANMSSFVKLNKHKVEFKVVNEEKRLLMGVALIPNQKIYRNEFAEEGECEVYFSAETIKEISHRFQKAGSQNNTTLEHAVELEKNTVVETWIKEHDVHDKSVMHNIDTPVGSWIISMKVEDDTAWESAKNGLITGFSIEGLFPEYKVENSVDELYQSIMKM